MAQNLGNLFISSESAIEDDTDNHTFSNVGVSLSTTSKYGDQSLYFDGNSTTHLTIPNSPDFTFEGDFTIDFWIYIAENQPEQVFSTGPNGVQFLRDGRAFYFKVDSDLLYYVAPEPGLSVSTWTHIAIVRSGSQIVAYKDGTLLTYTLTGGSITNSATINGTGLVIGDGIDANDSFHGNIDNFRVVKGTALWTEDFNVDDLETMCYKLSTIRPDNISELYNKKQINLRGKAAEGFIRPTIAQFFTSMNFEEIISNIAPVANPDSAECTVNNSVVIDLTANDTDVDLDDLIITDLTTPANGTLENHGDGTVTYTPTTDYYGSDSFDYTIEDNKGASDTSTVSITVNEVVSVSTQNIQWTPATDYSLSVSNNKATHSGAEWSCIRSAQKLTSKSYFEIQCEGYWSMPGVITTGHTLEVPGQHIYLGRKHPGNPIDQGTQYGWSIESWGRLWHADVDVPQGSFTPFTSGGRIGVAVDPPNGKLWFSVNGVWLNSGNPATGSLPSYTNIPSAGVYAAISLYSTYTGQFMTPSYNVPSGFTPYA